MMLILSLLLALVPLLGIAWILMKGLVTTVDGLFMSLILLAMSGIVGLNVLLELRKRGRARQTGILRAQPQRFPAGSPIGERSKAFNSTNPVLANPTNPL